MSHALGSTLSARAEAVAASLERGDTCRARTQALALRGSVTASIRDVPQALQEDLSSGANILLDKVPPCVQLAPARTGKEDSGRAKHEKHKGKRKDKHRGEDRD